MNAPPEPLRAREAADLLTAELGGEPARWATWLKNDRRPGRAHLLPPVPGPGRPRYLRSVVDAYIAAERGRRLRDNEPPGRVAEVLKAVGIGEEGGSPTGRRLDCRVTAQFDEEARAGFVQFVIAAPLLVFRLDPNQARNLARQLEAEAADADHLSTIAAKGDQA